MAKLSARRMVCVMPVEAIIGKMAPSDQKVTADNQGFKCFVGFQNKHSVFNRYQVRSRPRTSAVKQEELVLRKKFADTVKATRLRLNDPDKSLADQIAYSQQTKYKTLYSYVFNLEYNK